MSSRRVAGIYQITCTANGKIYVGSSKEVYARFTRHRSRLRVGQHRNKHLQSAYDKYGEDAFTFQVLEEIPDATPEYLIERETHWFGVTNCTDREVGFNRDLPGCTPVRKGKEHPLYGVKGKDHPAFGYKRSEESEKERVASLKLAWSDEELREAHRQIGLKLAEKSEVKERLKRMAAAGNDKRRKISDETKKEIKRLYAAGGLTNEQIGQLFSLTKDSVYNIVRPKKVKLDEKIKQDIREQINSGISMNRLSRMYGVSTTTIWRVEHEHDDKNTA